MCLELALSGHRHEAGAVCILWMQKRRHREAEGLTPGLRAEPRSWYLNVGSCISPWTGWTTGLVWDGHCYPLPCDVAASTAHLPINRRLAGGQPPSALSLFKAGLQVSPSQDRKTGDTWLPAPAAPPSGPANQSRWAPEVNTCPLPVPPAFWPEAPRLVPT